MTESQLSLYIRQRLKEGVSENQIVDGLVSNGWERDEVEVAIEKIQAELHQQASISDASVNNLQTENNSLFSEREAGMPNWINLLLRLYSVFILATCLFLFFSLFDLGREFIAFSEIFTEDFLSKVNLLIFSAYSVTFVLTFANLIYGIGLFRLRSWTIPIYFFIVVSSTIVSALMLIFGNFTSLIYLFGVLLILIIFISLAIMIWFHRSSFVGPFIKLWIQIPIFLVLLPVFIFSIVTQIYTDAKRIDDKDLVLRDVVVLAEEDNVYYDFIDIQKLSSENSPVFEQAKKQYSELASGNEVDFQITEQSLGVLTGVTNSFIEASRKQGYQCPTLINRYDLNAEVCSLREIRNVANITLLRSYFELKQGEVANSLMSAFAVGRVGRLINSEHPISIENLVAINMINLSIEAIARVVDKHGADMPADMIQLIIGELKTYEFDGSSVAEVVKREYMGRKDFLKPLESISGYFWHQNRINNYFTERTRLQLEVATAECGDDLVQKNKAYEAFFIDYENAGFSWWHMFRPNSIGDIFKNSMVTNYNARFNECEVNEINSNLQKQLLNLINN